MTREKAEIDRSAKVFGRLRTSSAFSFFFSLSLFFLTRAYEERRLRSKTETHRRGGTDRARLAVVVRDR